MLNLFLAALLQLTSPEAKGLLAQVEASMASAKSAQAAKPPPKDDAEKIIRLGEIDQAPRAIIVRYDFSRIPEAERDAAIRAMGALVDAQDAENLKALLALVPAEGWFSHSRYGEEAAIAAFHIVQHSDAAQRRRFLPIMQAMAAKGEADGQAVAQMYDRLAINEGRLQRYGTQFRCDGGKLRPWPMEEPEAVDSRRKAAGIDFPFSEYRAMMSRQPPCDQTQTPPPPGMVLD